METIQAAPNVEYDDLAPSTIRRALTRSTFLEVIWFSTAHGQSTSQSISSSFSFGTSFSAPG